MLIPTVVEQLKQVFGMHGRTTRLVTTELPGSCLSSPDPGGLEGGIGICILISTIA